MNPSRWIAAFVAIVSLGGTVAHAGADTGPEDWKTRLCREMSDVAVRAQFNRDQGRPMPVYPDDGSPAARIANALTRRVYDEPSVTSPKRAQAFGRVYCAEQLQ